MLLDELWPRTAWQDCILWLAEYGLAGTYPECLGVFLYLQDRILSWRGIWSGREEVSSVSGAYSVCLTSRRYVSHVSPMTERFPLTVESSSGVSSVSGAYSVPLTLLAMFSASTSARRAYRGWTCSRGMGPGGPAPPAGGTDHPSPIDP